MSGNGNKYKQDPEAVLDLHGYTRLEALRELEDFLYDSIQEGFGVVRVITGKGLHNPEGVSVLRNAVEAYLQEVGYNFRYGKWGQGENGVLDISL